MFAGDIFSVFYFLLWVRELLFLAEVELHEVFQNASMYINKKISRKIMSKVSLFISEEVRNLYINKVEISFPFCKLM